MCGLESGFILRMPRVPLIFDPEGDDGLSADLLEEE
jgi:hypothetical protein